jgi:hypothetical protein
VTSPTPPRVPPLARQRFKQFIVSVAALHVAAIALFYALDLRHASPDRQRLFAWIWMGATVLVVLVGLRRIRRARLELNRHRA